MSEKATKIERAVVPVAGRATRLWPQSRAAAKALLPAPGADGVLRPLVHHLALAALDGGAPRVTLVADPAAAPLIERYFDQGPDDPAAGAAPPAVLAEFERLAGRVDLAIQTTPRGLGHAVGLCRGDGDVLVMLGDYLFTAGARAVAELLAAWERLNCDSLVGVQQIGPEKLPTCGVPLGFLYNAGGGGGLAGRIWRVTDLIEKPAAEFARKKLRSEGLPADRFLAHYGLYVFGAGIFEQLDRLGRQTPADGEVLLTEAQRGLLAAGGLHLALELPGEALDMGSHEAVADAWRRLLAV